MANQTSIFSSSCPTCLKPNRRSGRLPHQTPLVKVVEADVDGVHVTLNLPGASLFEEMRAKPWKYYQFAEADVLPAQGHELASVRAHS